MNSRTRIGLLALAGVTLAGCAAGNRIGKELGWASQREAPSADVQASCQSSVLGLKGRPDHDTALRACEQAKTRQHVR